MPKIKKNKLWKSVATGYPLGDCVCAVRNEIEPGIFYMADYEAARKLFFLRLTGNHRPPILAVSHYVLLSENEPKAHTSCFLPVKQVTKEEVKEKIKEIKKKSKAKKKAEGKAKE